MLDVVSGLDVASAKAEAENETGAKRPPSAPNRSPQLGVRVRGASTGPHNEIRRCKMKLRRGDLLAYLTEKSSSLSPRHLNEREAAGSREERKGGGCALEAPRCEQIEQEQRESAAVPSSAWPPAFPAFRCVHIFPAFEYRSNLPSRGAIRARSSASLPV